MFLATSGDSENVAHEIVIVHGRSSERQLTFAQNIDKGKCRRRTIRSPTLDFEDDIGGAFVEVFKCDV